MANAIEVRDVTARWQNESFCFLLFAGDHRFVVALYHERADSYRCCGIYSAANAIGTNSSIPRRWRSVAAIRSSLDRQPHFGQHKRNKTRADASCVCPGDKSKNQNSLIFTWVKSHQIKLIISINCSILYSSFPKNKLKSFHSKKYVEWMKLITVHAANFVMRSAIQHGISWMQLY